MSAREEPSGVRGDAEASERVRLEIEAGRLEAADRLLDDGEVRDPDTVAALRATIERARSGDAPLQEEQLELVARARELIQAGDFRAACDELRSSPEDERSAESRELLHETEAHLEEQASHDEASDFTFLTSDVDDLLDEGSAADTDDPHVEGPSVEGPSVEGPSVEEPSVEEPNVAKPSDGPGSGPGTDLGDEGSNGDPEGDLEAERDQLREHHVTSQLELIDGHLAEGQLEVAANELRVLLKLAGDHRVAQEKLEEVEAALAENQRSAASAATAAEKIDSLLGAGRPPSRRESPGSRLEPAAAAPAEGSQRATTVVSEKPVEKRTTWLVAAAVILLSVALVWIWQRNTEPDAAASTDASGNELSLEAAASATPALGSATIDAAPWAEVLSIVDASGNPLQVPQPAFTPVLLQLPPGRYQVTLAYGDDRELEAPAASSSDATEVSEPSEPAGLRTVDIEIRSDQSTPYRVEFEPIDVDEFFESLGW